MAGTCLPKCFEMPNNSCVILSTTSLGCQGPRLDDNAKGTSTHTTFRIIQIDEQYNVDAGSAPTGGTPTNRKGVTHSQPSCDRSTKKMKMCTYNCIRRPRIHLAWSQISLPAHAGDSRQVQTRPSISKLAMPSIGESPSHNFA